jgi:thioredoxin 1
MRGGPPVAPLEGIPPGVPALVAGMATIELTGATFQDAVADNDIVLVDWWASWCGPCRMFAPVFEEASSRHPDLVFAKVNTEAEPALAGAAGIMSIPTLMVFRENVLVYSQPGALPAASLDDLIAQVRQLDMTEVHRAVAARA